MILTSPFLIHLVPCHHFPNLFLFIYTLPDFVLDPYSFSIDKLFSGLEGGRALRLKTDPSSTSPFRRVVGRTSKDSSGRGTLGPFLSFLRLLTFPCRLVRMRSRRVLGWSWWCGRVWDGGCGTSGVTGTKSLPDRQMYFSLCSGTQKVKFS